jgi:hypothetical protein
MLKEITVTEESSATLEIDLGKAQGKKGIARLGGSVRKEKSSTLKATMSWLTKCFRALWL